MRTPRSNSIEFGRAHSFIFSKGLSRGASCIIIVMIYGPIAQLRLERTPDKREVGSSTLPRPTHTYFVVVDRLECDAPSRLVEMGL